MSRIFRRTSITVDEAIYILLDQIDGPIEFTPVDDSDMEDTGDIWFCLEETLTDELEVIEGEYAFAKYENQPADVIAEKSSRLQQHKEVIAQANAYRSAIRDELNKGEQSALNVDKVLSNAAYTYITLHSFSEWAKKFGKAILANLQTTGSVEPTISSPLHTGKGIKSPPRNKLHRQDDAILAEVERQGYDPLSLPENPSGKAGVKASVREALQYSTLFEASTAFEKAWGRLRTKKRIKTLLPPK